MQHHTALGRVLPHRQRLCFISHSGGSTSHGPRTDPRQHALPTTPPHSASLAFERPGDFRGE
ncbi:Hypothetical protein AA314_06215 [Archangium gephyra]|uniref:Uncharacterized protein n=1 Tax=Archangium gephyra TaxID=48 RepID=A0AAC8QBY8_9BACT|nr:Hypothetical protein AA314_06215 [Archangium gephyra]